MGGDIYGETDTHLDAEIEDAYNEHQYLEPTAAEIAERERAFVDYDWSTHQYAPVCQTDPYEGLPDHMFVSM